MVDAFLQIAEEFAQIAARFSDSVEDVQAKARV